jgi:hypothetical protein
MKSILKFNPKHHIPNDNDTIPQELIKDTKHGASKIARTITCKKRYFKH